MKTKPKAKTIALTGGIASGKSAVSALFGNLGIKIIDADIIAREVVQAKTQGLDSLVSAFGKEILHSDGSLDREKFRKIIFADDNKLQQTNAILHPLINDSIKKQVRQIQKGYIMVVIPLLCESKKYKWLDRVLVVDVKRETQMQRLLARDHIDEDLANKMIASQCSRQKRLAMADDVIVNEKSFDNLTKQVEILNSLYKSL